VLLDGRALGIGSNVAITTNITTSPTATISSAVAIPDRPSNTSGRLGA